MQPTNKLRWFSKKSSFSDEPQVLDGYGDRLVLQQWFYLEDDYGTHGEWRDVPIDEEE